MSAIFWSETVLFIAAFSFFCVGTWRLLRSRGAARPLLEYLSMLGVMGFSAWQAPAWIRAGRAGVGSGRHMPVWITFAFFAGMGLMVVLAVMVIVHKIRRRRPRFKLAESDR